MKKQIALLLLTSCLVLGVTACGSEAAPDPVSTPTPTLEATSEPTAEPTQEPTPDPTQEPEEEQAEEVEYPGFTFYDPRFKLSYDVDLEKFIDEAGNPIENIMSYRPIGLEVPEDHEHALIYEPAVGFMDMDTSWSVDTKTGLLIDPETGELVTKESVILNSRPWLPEDRAWVDDLYNKLIALDVDAVVEILKDPELMEKAEPYKNTSWVIYGPANTEGRQLVTTDGKVVGLITQNGNTYVFYSTTPGYGFIDIGHGDVCVYIEDGKVGYFDGENDYLDGKVEYNVGPGYSWIVW